MYVRDVLDTTKKGVRTPLIMSTQELKSSCMMGGHGITNSFFAENGKIIYGPSDDRYKDYLAVLKLWYDEGYLDPEFGNLTAKVKDSRVLNGEAGAYIGVMGSSLQRCLTLQDGKDENFSLQPVQYMVKERGQIQDVTNLSNMVTTTAASITTAAKNPDLVLSWMDYS